MTVGPSPQALAALQRDLGEVLGTSPGLTPVQAARRLQMRLPVLWAVLAPLIEYGDVVIRGQGAYLSVDAPPLGSIPVAGTAPAT